MPMFSGSLDNLKRAFSDTATTLDTPPQTDHLLRMQTLQTGDSPGHGGK